MSVFGVGRVRDKGRGSNVLVFSIYGVKNNHDAVLPFFDEHPLLVKAKDYRLFSKVVRTLYLRGHLEPAGFERVVRWAYAMNANGRQRKRTLEEVLRGSSETVREARGPHATGVMSQSELHGDMQSQAEMTWPLSARE